MKTSLVLLGFLYCTFATADDFMITPGSSISIGSNTISCSINQMAPEDRCKTISSTSSLVRACSGRLRGSRCAVGDLRGICDLATSGFTDFCECQ